MNDFTSTFFLYNHTEDGGIRILRCRSLDCEVEIPETIDGAPVVELGAYVFSEHVRGKEYVLGQECDVGREHGSVPKREYVLGQERGRYTGTEKEMENIPEMKGEKLTGLSLPAGLRKVGAYCFYNCWNLKRLSCHSTTLDWGAGAFTGCNAITKLDIQVREGEKSCLKEILAELRQTLLVIYRGRQEARLWFPEFYEESVENTPARILETHVHGCGHQYRYCFLQSEFQFAAYDSLFYYVKVQEQETLVMQLAAGRLRYPYQLTKKAKKDYEDYLAGHRVKAAALAVAKGDMGLLRWLMENIPYGHEELASVLDAALKGTDSRMLSYLMDLQVGQKRPGERPERKRFEL